MIDFTKLKIIATGILVTLIISLFVYNAFLSKTIEQLETEIKIKDGEISSAKESLERCKTGVKAIQTHTKNIQKNAKQFNENQRRIDGISNEKEVEDMYNSILGDN